MVVESPIFPEFLHVKKNSLQIFFLSLNSSLHRVCKKLSLLFVVRPVDPFSNLHAAKTLGFRLFFFSKLQGFLLLFFLMLGMMDHHGSWWIMMDHEEFEHPLNQSDLILRTSTTSI